MKHELIQTENYLLIVDDSEIKYNDHFIDEYKMLYMLKNGSVERYKSVKKVIAHLPINGAPVLEGIDLLDNNIFINYLKEFGYWNSFCIFIEKLYNEKRNI